MTQSVSMKEGKVDVSAASLSAKRSYKNYGKREMQSSVAFLSSSTASLLKPLIPSQTISSTPNNGNRRINRNKAKRKVIQRLHTGTTCSSNSGVYEKNSFHHSPSLLLIPSQSVTSRTNLHNQKKPFEASKRTLIDGSRRFHSPTTSLYSATKSMEEPYNDNSTNSEKARRNIITSTTNYNLKDDEAGDTIIDHATPKKQCNTTTSRSASESPQTKSKNDINPEKFTDERKGKILTRGRPNKKSYSNKTQSFSSPSKGRKPQKYSFSYTGNLPDIHWRAIPMNHLRLHPNYQPLPQPKTITKIHNLEDVRYFRQDSWQWDMLHSGRCTTSQAAPALGLLEGNAAKLLGIPKSLQKGCMSAYIRLGQNALRTIEEMNTVLCEEHDEEEEEENERNYVDGDDKYYHNDSMTQKQQSSRRPLWKKIPQNRFPFAARYSPQVTEDQLNDRRMQTKKYMSTLSSPMRIRMNWGNTQEATAILTVLNYFHSIDPSIKVKEVGMCGAGLKYNSTLPQSCYDSEDALDIHKLILGASPDAVIEYSDGTLEALEVKNHCPFVPMKKQLRDDPDGRSSLGSNRTNFGSSGRDRGNYRIREMPMYPTVPPVYIPQLMMEMLCLGEECRSAVMCRQTATNGAILVRLHRDDDWINEMIYWLERFVDNYVKKGSPPPRNFFWFDEDGNVCKRYEHFVQRTKELSDEVELVQYIEHGSIQRVLGAKGVRLPLFLD